MSRASPAVPPLTKMGAGRVTVTSEVGVCPYANSEMISPPLGWRAMQVKLALPTVTVAAV